MIIEKWWTMGFRPERQNDSLDLSSSQSHPSQSANAHPARSPLKNNISFITLLNYSSYLAPYLYGTEPQSVITVSLPFFYGNNKKMAEMAGQDAARITTVNRNMLQRSRLHKSHCVCSAFHIER